MIKLKSLFRRGQSASHNSSKHSVGHQQQQQQQQQQQPPARQCHTGTQSRNRHKSRSTQSLNTAGEVECKPPSTPTTTTTNIAAATTTITTTTTSTTTLTAHYPSHTHAQLHSHIDSEGVCERGIDVGDSVLVTGGARGGHKRHQWVAVEGQTAKYPLTAAGGGGKGDGDGGELLGSQTLPHKKSSKDGVFREGFKLPKLQTAPPRKNNNNNNNKYSTALIAKKRGKGYDESVRGGQGVISDHQNSNISKNSAAMAAVASGAPNTGQTVNSTEDKVPSSDELYTLNPAFVAAAAAAGYQFISKEQQQMWESTNNKMQELQKQLERLNREKLMADTRISELLPYQVEVNSLRGELIRMQSVQEKQQLEIVNLKYENESLRNRLRDVVNSPLSDAEKHQLIQDSQRLHSSAPASIALPTTTDSNEALLLSGINAVCVSSNIGGGGGGVGGGTTSSGGVGGVSNTSNAVGGGCLTPADWDKHSSSSEISVACLQDKIIQMEETHYSTNEELQATLQELADLQSQLSDAQAENERLLEEKDVLFQSLCRQTEKLNESRSQVTNLQGLLLNSCDGTSKTTSTNSTSNSTSQLTTLLNESNSVNLGNVIKVKEDNADVGDIETTDLELLKEAQGERDRIQTKYDQLNVEVERIREHHEQLESENVRLRECNELLQSTLDTEHSQRKQLEQQLLTAKDDISQNSIESKHLTTLLENAKTKIDDLEQELTSGTNKTDVSELLETARKEKDLLELRNTELQEQLARNKIEQRRLTEKYVNLEEEYQLTNSNQKCTITRLEYCLEQLKRDKSKLTIDNQQLCANTNELQIQCKCYLDDKEQLQKLLNDTEQLSSDLQCKLHETQKRLEELELQRQEETEEWEQYQSDLLMTVRVANDFKTEALCAREQLALENKTLKEKIRMMEQQLDKISKQQQQQNETQQSVLSTVQQEMASRRNKMAGNFTRQDSRLSVKTLIETIENNKQSKTEESVGGVVGTATGVVVSLSAEREANYSSDSSSTSTQSSSTSSSSSSSPPPPPPSSSTAAATTTTSTTTPTTSTNTITTTTTTTLTTRGELTAGSALADVNGRLGNSTQQSKNNASHLLCSAVKGSGGGGTGGVHFRDQQQQQQSQHQTSASVTTSTITSTAGGGVGVTAPSLNLSTLSKSFVGSGERRDPLNMLAKNGGSKRNALLKWCQNKTVGYRNIDITNFSSSWNDGLALCAILHSYLPDRIPYDTLTPANKRRNFALAFAAAESVGINTTLNINDMCQIERPDWTLVMSYVTAIYKRFET